MKRPEKILSQPWKIQEYINWLESQLAEAKEKKSSYILHLKAAWEESEKENTKLKEGLKTIDKRLKLHFRYGSNGNGYLEEIQGILGEAPTQEKGEEKLSQEEIEEDCRNIPN